MKVWVIALLISSSLLFGMDRFSINRSDYQEIPSHPECLRSALEGRKKLKEAVEISFIERAAKKVDPERYRLFPDKNSDPENLIAYIYYIKLQPSCPELWDEMVNWKIPHQKLVSAQVHGYSVYGAAVVAEGLSREAKKQVITNLHMLGFKPNKKDYELDKLEAWEQDDMDYQHPLIPAG